MWKHGKTRRSSLGAGPLSDTPPIHHPSFAFPESDLAPSIAGVSIWSEMLSPGLPRPGAANLRIAPVVQILGEEADLDKFGYG